jgi:hypothetical protein
MRPFLVQMPIETVRRTRLLRLRIEALDGLGDGMAQVLLIGRDGALRDLQRFEFVSQPGLGLGQRAWFGVDRTIACDRVHEVMILVASRQHGGDFRLELGKMPELPVLQASGCNALPNRTILEPPLVQAWNWQAPDIKHVPSIGGFSVAVRNIGTAPAEGLRVDAWTLPIEQFPHGSGWRRATRLPAPYDEIPVETADECRRIDIYDGLDGVPRMSARQRRECAKMNGRTLDFKLPEGSDDRVIVAARATAGGDPNGAVHLIGALTHHLPAALTDMRKWPQEHR